MKYISLFAFLLLFSCKKENDKEVIKPKLYYLTAKIDGSTWQLSGFDKVRFSTAYIYSKDRFVINIHADNFFYDPPHDYGKAISFSFDFTPAPGKYYFNNIGPSSIDSGLIATYAYWKENHHAVKWSESGYIEIKSISKDSISGSFSFSVIGDASNPDKTHITEGKFNAIYGGGTDKEWPGPK